MMALLFIFLALAIAGVSMWYLAPTLLFGYITGLVIGLTLMVSIIQQLGKRAKKSTLASEAFYKLTKYKATIYRIDRDSPNREIVTTIYKNGHGDTEDFVNVVEVLKRQMRFPPDRAKEAARYAMDIGHEQPFGEKLRIALQFLDKPNNNHNDKVEIA